MYRSLIQRFGHFILGLFLLASGAMGVFLADLQIEPSVNVFLDQSDDDLAYYNLTRTEWAYDEYAMVCIRREDWFTPDALKQLASLTADLAEAPYVRSTTSLLDVPLMRNRTGLFALLQGPASLTDASVDLERARKEILEDRHTQAVGNLISEDGRDLTIIVNLDVNEDMIRLDREWARAQGEHDAARLEELKPAYDAALGELRRRRSEMVEALRRITAGVERELTEPVRLSGLPIISQNIMEHVDEDIRTFSGVTLALFAAGFVVVYRKFRWTLLPMMTCAVTPVLIVGAMAAFGVRITAITSYLPVLLFVLTLPYAVHFVERYRERRAEKPQEDNPESTLGAARAIWMPCLFSALTTMAGFAALYWSVIDPISSFGVLMSLGMAVALGCAFLFLPSAVRPLRPEAPPGPGNPVETLLRGVVRTFAAAALARPALVVLAGLALMAGGIAGALRLNVENKFISYFRPRSEVYRGLEYIDTRMGGTTPLEVILVSKQEGFFATEEGVAAVAAAGACFEDLGEPGDVGSLRSLSTLLDEIRKTVRSMTVPALEKIEAARPLLREYVNDDYTKARVLVRFRETSPTLSRNRILAEVRRRLAAAPELAGLKEARATGVFVLYANMLDTLDRGYRWIPIGKWETPVVVMAIVLGMLLCLFRSFATAVAVLVSQALPVSVCLGTMGWTGVPLDLVTVMIASIAMGVGIDAAIQYTVRYAREVRVDGDRRAAVGRAHATVGRAIWIATSVVVAGFAVLAFSNFMPTVYFGLFTGLAMLMGQFAALTVLPALLLLLRLPRTPTPRPE